MTELEQQQRFPGSPGAAGSQATLVEQTRAAAEVAAAVNAARMVPRDYRTCQERMRTACAEYGLAERAAYSYNMGGSEGLVNGPTVTLARELAAIYGNVEFGTQELSRDDVAKRSEVRAFCRDWETNAYSSRTVIVPHVQFTAKEPKALTKPRFIDMNNNSVAGRALREQIFAILPAAFLAEAVAICAQTRNVGDGRPLAERIDEAVATFGKAKPPVKVTTLEEFIGHPRPRWDGSDVARLSVLFQSLKSGEVTRAEAFPNEGGDITSDDIRRQAAPVAAGADDVPGNHSAPAEYDPTLEPGFGKDA